MARKNTAALYLEYGLAKIFSLFVRLLPWSVALFVGRILGRLAAKTFRQRSRLAFQNLALAFPEKSRQELKYLVSRVWQNIGQTLVQFLKITSFSEADFSRRAEFKGKEYIDQALSQGRGLIFLGAHFGNWELIGAAVAHLGYPLAVVARPLDNYLLNEQVNRIREFHGATVILKKKAAKESLRWLKKNGILGILIDQNFYEGGVFVDFFGRPAATTNIISLLAEKTGARILPIFSRHNNGKIIVTVEPPVDIKNLDSSAATQELTKIIEDWIRRYPEEWFWIHDRWKRKP